MAIKIYTKQGDQGQTGLFGGPRVAKDHQRIKSYGSLDELNAVLGWALSHQSLQGPLRERLTRIQGELFQLGAELATPPGKKPGAQLIESSHIKSLETEIDSMETELAPLRSFILPGGGDAASALHMARTVSRRAEREIVTLNREEPLRAEVIQYVNRLSDYFFVAARFANHQAGIADVPWKAPSPQAKSGGR